MQWDDIVQKFRRLTNGVVSVDAQTRVVDAVAGIEALDGPAVMNTLKEALV